jgi:hypothetical protein
VTIPGDLPRHDRSRRFSRLPGHFHLQAIVKQRLKRIQYRTDLIDSFVVHTGLTIEPHQP